MTRVSIEDNTALHIAQQGEGPILLLVHGFPLDHSMWAEQLETLSQHFRVIAPDLRGFGQSEVTEGVVTMQQLADDLAQLLDALQITAPVHLCGLSMGGYVAWQFFQRHRDRLASLILCDTRAAADTPEVAEGRRVAAERVLAEGTGFLADSMLEKLFAPSTLQQNTTIVEATRQALLAAPPQGVAAAARGMALRPDATELLPEIDVPALVVCGQFDAISTIPEMQTISQRIPNARFVIIPEAGHMSPLENAPAVNQAVEQFLTSLAPVS